MISRRGRKALKVLAIAVVTVIGVVLFSAVSATRTCNVALRGQLPPDYLDTHFAFRPNKHIDGIPEVGLSPGWVVAYATPNKMFGEAFHVSPFGKILAHGTPIFVVETRIKDRQSIEEFSKQFFEADERLHVNAPFSEAIAVLGPPHWTQTNDSALVDAYYDYRPPGNSLIDWITNGLVLTVSNDVVNP
jgi:hypothetical protein